MIIKLLRGCEKFDRTAQREMINHLSPFLFNICRRYVSNNEDAKDLLQESLILIFNNINACKAREAAGFKAWCRRIAINTALSKKRKKSYEEKPLGEADFEESALSPIESKLNVDDILKLLGILPSNQRLVFNLAIIDGYSHKEISTLLNIKESSSRTFLMRARQSLQQLILQQEIK